MPRPRKTLFILLLSLIPYLTLFSQNVGVSGTCVDGPLRIRELPTTDSGIMGRLENGDDFKVLGRSSFIEEISGYSAFWYQIRREGITGFVYGAFVELDDPDYDQAMLDPSGEMFFPIDIYPWNHPTYHVEDTRLSYLNATLTRTVTGDFTFVDYDAEREAFFVINDEFEYGLISKKDLMVTNYYAMVEDYSSLDQTRGITEKNMFLEKKHLENNPFAHRNGPILTVLTNRGPFEFIDGFRWGPFYNLVDYVDNRFHLIHSGFYEGSYNSLLNNWTGAMIEDLYSPPLFSPARKYFLSYGTFYAEPDELRLFDVTRGDIIVFNHRFEDPGYDDYIREIEWLEEEKILITFKTKSFILEKIRDNWELREA